MADVGEKNPRKNATHNSSLAVILPYSFGSDILKADLLSALVRCAGVFGL